MKTTKYLAAVLTVAALAAFRPAEEQMTQTRGRRARGKRRQTESA